MKKTTEPYLDPTLAALDAGERAVEIKRREAEQATLVAQKTATARALGQMPAYAGASPQLVAEPGSAYVAPRVDIPHVAAEPEAPAVVPSYIPAPNIERQVEEVLAANPGAPAGSLQARINELIALHRVEMDAAEHDFKTTLAILLKEQGEADREAAQEIDPTVVERTTAAVAAVKAFDTHVDTTAADAFTAELTARLEPDRVKAHDTMSALASFAETYRAGWSTLNAVDRETWLAGLPTQGTAGVHFLTLVASLQRHVEGALSLLSSAETTIPKCLRELDDLVKTIAVRGPFPWQPTTADPRAQWCNGVLRDLRAQTEGGVLSSLNSFALTIANMVEGVTAAKRKYASLPVEPIQYDDVRAAKGRDAIADAVDAMDKRANPQQDRAILGEGWAGLTNA